MIVPPWASAAGSGCSLFDLGRIGAHSAQHYNTVSLKRLVAGIVGLDLMKSSRLARSPWGRVPLRNEELCYAARDAWSAAAIVHKLTTLDPERFSPEAIRQRLTTKSHDDERDEKSTTIRNNTMTYSVAELSHRAAKRKALKNHAKDLKETRLMFQKQQQQQTKEENSAITTPTRVP